MRGFNIGLGVGIRFAAPIRLGKGGGTIPIRESCFSSGIWKNKKLWLNDTKWRYSVLSTQEVKNEYKI